VWFSGGDYFRVPLRLDLGPDPRQSLRQVIDNKVQEPRPKLKVDDPVLVQQQPSDTWQKQHFAGWGEDGTCKTYKNGRTSFTAADIDDTISWPFYKLPEEAQ
jgi:hypothetical protein